MHLTYIDLVLLPLLPNAPQASWPIVFSFLSSAQRQLLSGEHLPSSSKSSESQPESHHHGKDRRGGRRHRSAAAISAAVTAEPLWDELPAAQDATVIESLDERFLAAAAAGTPAAAGGVTDPQNRLSHVLRAMAAAPHDIIEKHSRDWVPLFLSYTAARGSHFDDGEGDVAAVVAAARAATTAAAAEAQEPADGRPRKKVRRSDADGDTAGAADGESGVSGGGGGGGTVSVLSLIGGKTWRSGLLDWLKMLSGLKGVRGLFRHEELQTAVASHLLEADGGVQGAALKCLRPYKFRWLPPEMAERLGRLADDGTLRVGQRV